jgi:hypothetical protein
MERQLATTDRQNGIPALLGSWVGTELNRLEFYRTGHNRAEQNTKNRVKQNRREKNRIEQNIKE